MAATYRLTPAGAVAAYAPPSEGPFRCDRCEYALTRGAQLHCKRPEVVEEFKYLRGLDRWLNTAPIEDAACCNFFEPR